MPKFLNNVPENIEVTIADKTLSGKFVICGVMDNEGGFESTMVGRCSEITLMAVVNTLLENLFENHPAAATVAVAKFADERLGDKALVPHAAKAIAGLMGNILPFASGAAGKPLQDDLLSALGLTGLTLPGDHPFGMDIPDMEE